MKKICIATIVLAMAILVSCGSIEETTPKLIKSIEVLVDGEHINTITYKYDNQNRLIEVDNALDNKHFKDSIIYLDDEIWVISEAANTTYTYKYSNGKPTECCIDQLKLCTHYYYEGDKISSSKDDYDCITYKWEKGCITEMYQEKFYPHKATFEYTDIQNSFTIGIEPLLLFSITSYNPGLSSFGSWSTSELLPSKSTITIDDYLNKTIMNSTYEYIFDSTIGTITEIKISENKETKKDGKFQKESSTKTLKITYY